MSKLLSVELLKISIADKLKIISKLNEKARIQKHNLAQFSKRKEVLEKQVEMLKSGKKAINDYRFAESCNFIMIMTVFMFPCMFIPVLVNALLPISAISGGILIYKYRKETKQIRSSLKELRHDTKEERKIERNKIIKGPENILEKAKKLSRVFENVAFQKYNSALNETNSLLVKERNSYYETLNKVTHYQEIGFKLEQKLKNAAQEETFSERPFYHDENAHKLILQI